MWGRWRLLGRWRRQIGECGGYANAKEGLTHVCVLKARKHSEEISAYCILGPMNIDPLPPESTSLYEKAPVVEVIYSIRVAIPAPVDIELFKKAITERFPGQFPNSGQFKTIQGAVNVQQDGSTNSNIQVDAAGYRFVSGRGDIVVHYLQQSLTMNFLSPYSGYTEAMVQLKEHWKVYSEIADNAAPIGLSLRYIDKIDIPAQDHLNLNEYFTIVARMPEGLSAHHCYQQYWFNKPGSDIRARVIWSSLDPIEGKVSFALDTEAILEPVNFEGTESMWKRFDDLHAWCWYVFNHSLTPTCKELFK